MLAYRSFLRTYIQASISTKNLQNQQRYQRFHGLSCELRMDVSKGKVHDIKRKKQETVTQTWRKFSTQPNSFLGGKEEPQSVKDEHSVTLDVSHFGCEDTKLVNEPASLHGCSSTKGGVSDVYVDRQLVCSEKISVSVEIGGLLMRFVRGKGGGTQEEIEQETGVKIIFPSSKKEDTIIIEGNSAESVAKASEKIQSIIDKAVNSREFDYSHFVSLPLAVHPALVEKLISFQKRILGMDASDQNENLNSDTVDDTSDMNEEGPSSSKSSKDAVEPRDVKADGHVEVKIGDIPLVSYHPKESKTPASRSLIELGIEKSIFIKPKTFHLTVLMLKLWNKDRLKAASEVLTSVSSRVMDALEGRPVSIRLKGLDCMKGSLSKARVLYAPIEEVGGEGRLLRACQVITDAFIKAGLVMEKDVQQKLKLHATLMNARHRKRNHKTRKLDSFDARGIFDKYVSEEWGEYHVREAHLSQRFVFDENGYYHCCASIPFPRYDDVLQID